MGKIFVSYRRDDSADVSGRIFDRLIAHFGRPAVFIDVDNIPPGVDFRAHIADAIGQSTVLLAIIGPKWCDSVNADGERRLDDPGDFVRIEIESALERNIHVIPLLVREAKVPATLQLPESLRKLVYLNAPEVRSGHDFHSHVDRLIRKLEENFGIERQAAYTMKTAGKDSGAPAPSIKGHCPQCGRNNPSERQFCGGCGEPLREPCFECEFVNEATDVFCGDCGIGLATNRRARIDKMTSDRERVERLRLESGHFEAIQILTDMQHAKHLRLKSFASWAGETLRVVQSEFDQWCQGAYTRAEQMCANKDFDGAVQLLEQIPVTARHIDASNLLSSAKHEAARRLEERVAEAEERRRLHLKLDDMRVKIIKTQPQNLERRIVLLEHFGGLAADAVRRFGAEEFQHFVDWGNLESKKKLDERRRQKQAQAARLDHLRSADLCLKQYAFTEALESLDLIPESERTPDDKSLIVRVRHTITQLAETTQRIEQAIRDRDYSQLPDVVGQYKAVKPLSQALLQKLAPWRTSVFDAASDQFNMHRYAEAIASLDQIPDSIRTSEMAALLAQAKQAIEEIRKLKATIAEARQQNDLRRLIPDLHRYLELRPDYVQGREFLDNLLANCLRSCKERFENRDYSGIVHHASKVPPDLRGRELALLLEQATTRCKDIVACNAELNRTMESGETQLWISAWMRFFELQPPHQMCEAAIRRMVTTRVQVVESMAHSEWSGLRPNGQQSNELEFSDAAIDELALVIRQIHRGDLADAVAKMFELAERIPEFLASAGFSQLRVHVQKQYVGPVWRLSTRGKPLCISYARVADQIAIGCEDGRVFIIDPTNMPLLREFSLDKGPIRQIAISPFGNKFLIAGSRDGGLLCLIDNKGKMTQLKGHRKITCVAISPDGRFAASGGDEDNAMIFVWDLEKGKVIHKLYTVGFLQRNKDLNTISDIAFTSDGATLVSCGKWGCDAINLWDVKTGSYLAKFPTSEYGHHNLSRVAVSSNGKIIASISESKKLEIWNAETQNTVMTVCIDAGCAIFCNNDTHVLWSTNRGSQIQALDMFDLNEKREVWYQPLSAAPLQVDAKKPIDGDDEDFQLSLEYEEELITSDSDVRLPNSNAQQATCEFKVVGRDEIALAPVHAHINDMILLGDARRVVLRQDSSIVLWSLPDLSHLKAVRSDRGQHYVAGQTDLWPANYGRALASKVLALLTTKHRGKDLLLASEMPAYHLANVEAIVRIPPEDRILAVVSNEIYHHAKRVFVFGCKGVYYNNATYSGPTAPAFIAYAQLADIQFENASEKIDFGKGRVFDLGHQPSSKKELSSVLRDVQELLRSEPDTIRNSNELEISDFQNGVSDFENLSDPISSTIPSTAEDDNYQLQPIPMELTSPKRSDDKPNKQETILSRISSGILGEEIRKLIRGRLKLPMINVFVAPDIPMQRLSNARKSCRVPSAEEIVAFIDCTRIGSGKDAFLFGREGVYYHNDVKSPKPGQGFIGYEEFKGRHFYHSGTDVDLGNGQSLDIRRCILSPSVFVEILNSVIEVIEPKGADIPFE